MKQLSIIIAVAALATSAFAQIGTTPGGHRDTKKSHDKEKVGDISNPEAETPPFIGMTKAAALARYGYPKKQTVTDEGEVWVYILNMGEVIGKAFIPFNFKPTLPRSGTLTFGPDAKVKKFTWDAPTKG